jgi:hypothetical protein
MAAAAAIQAAPVLIQAGLGIADRIRGSKMLRDTALPQYQTPESIKQNQALAAMLAMSGMPAEQYAAAAGNIERNQTAALEAVKRRGGNISNVNAITSGANNAYLNLDAANAQMKLRNQANLMNANQVMATYEDKAYNINKLQQYLMRMGIAGGLMTGGNSNIAGAVSGLAQLGENAYMSYENNKPIPSMPVAPTMPTLPSPSSMYGTGPASTAMQAMGA